MRAGPLSSTEVIDLLNHDFVCVYTDNEDYRGTRGSAPAEERKELERIWDEARAKRLSVGTVHAYVLTPDGHVVDSLHVAEAEKAGNTLAMLKRAVERFKPRPGQPAVPPAPQSHPPLASADSMVLHLVSRADDTGGWGAIPAENWIVLRSERWSRLLPPLPAEPGQTWDLDRDVSSEILTYFYPQTQNNDADIQRIEKLVLTAKVLSVENGSVTARIDGFVEMQHALYPGHKDTQPLRAEVVGVLVFQSSGVPSLRLVTTAAAHGARTFNVAVRTVPHATR